MAVLYQCTTISRHEREDSEDTSAQLLEFYGLTEGGVATTLIARKAAELGKLGSVGQVQPGGELKILGENGELLGPNESGEIVGRAGIMSDGYLNREEATKAMHWFDEQGRLFYRSGDVGYLDEDGWLFLSDRIKDMICRGSEYLRHRPRAGSERHAGCG